MIITMIYLRRDGLILTKKGYSDWRLIQDIYEPVYMTSITIDSKEILEFFIDDGLIKNDTLNKEKIIKFLDSRIETMSLDDILNAEWK